MNDATADEPTLIESFLTTGRLPLDPSWVEAAYAVGMDFTAAMYAVQTENRDGQQKQARVSVEGAQHERDAQLEASRQAIRQAEAEAAKAAEEGHKSGFFGRISSALALPSTALIG